MELAETEIRSRLKGVQVVSVVYVLVILVVMASIAIGGDPWLTIAMIAFAATWAMQVVFAVSLGYLAAGLGMGGVWVGIATFVGTPVLAPFNYIRVAKLAHKAMAMHTQNAKV
jgi:hypothetical protein